MGRLVWLGIGVGIGVYGTRRVQKVGQQVTASGIGRLAVDAHGRVTGFVGAVRVGMAERDAELRAVEQPGARHAPPVADPAVAAVAAVPSASRAGVGRAVGGTARALWVGYQAAAAERAARASGTAAGSGPGEAPDGRGGGPARTVVTVPAVGDDPDGSPGGSPGPDDGVRSRPAGSRSMPTPLVDRVP